MHTTCTSEDNCNNAWGPVTLDEKVLWLASTNQGMTVARVGWKLHGEEMTGQNKDWPWGTWGRSEEQRHSSPRGGSSPGVSDMEWIRDLLRCRW